MAFSARKKKTPLIEESDSSADEKCGTEDYSFSDDEIQAESNQSKVTPRSSERIKKKRNKKFHVPSKQEVWEKISPGKSPGKYEQLKPRKLVNNFTKENNRYNYDPNETSGDESLDNFIIDDEECVESSTSSDSACDIKAKKSMRIRGRHHRLRVGNPIEDSTSSDSDDTEGGNKAAVEDLQEACGNELRLSRRLRSQDKLEASSDVDLCDISERGKGKRTCVEEPKYDSSKRRKDSSKRRKDSLKRRKSNTRVIEDDNVSDSSSESSNVLQVRKCGKRNRSVIESDNESVESEIRVGRRNKHNRSVIESDSDEGVEVIMKNAELKLSGNVTTTGSSIQLSEGVDILNDVDDTIPGTNDGCIVHESENGFVGHNGLSTDKEETKFNDCNSGSKCEEELDHLPVCEATTSTNKSPGSIVSVSDSSDDTNEDSNNSSIESNDDDNSGNGDADNDNDDSELDDDLDVDPENSRIRVGKLHKKREKEKIFEKLRNERERKLSKSK